MCLVFGSLIPFSEASTCYFSELTSPGSPLRTALGDAVHGVNHVSGSCKHCFSPVLLPAAGQSRLAVSLHILTACTLSRLLPWLHPVFPLPDRTLDLTYLNVPIL